MKYAVKVKAGSSQEKIEAADGTITIWTRAKAHDGEANAAVVKALAKYFHTAKGNVRIISGATSRNKMIEVSE